jgi:hypothetical protein
VRGEVEKAAPACRQAGVRSQQDAQPDDDTDAPLTLAAIEDGDE